jgi:hypothetical protein
MPEHDDAEALAVAVYGSVEAALAAETEEYKRECVVFWRERVELLRGHKEELPELWREVEADEELLRRKMGADLFDKLLAEED